MWMSCWFRAFWYPVVWVWRERLCCENETACILKLACFDLLHKNDWKERTEVSIHTALCCNPHTVFPQVGRVMDMHNAKPATAKCSTFSPLMGTQTPSWGYWSSLKMRLEPCSTEPESTNMQLAPGITLEIWKSYVHFIVYRIYWYWSNKTLPQTIAGLAYVWFLMYQRAPEKSDLQVFILKCQMPSQIEEKLR